MNNIKVEIRTLITRCLYVRVNVGIQTIVHIFLKWIDCLFATNLLWKSLKATNFTAIKFM